MKPTVVVGYDGSAASERALVEAAHQASQREVPLTIVHAVRQEASRVAVPASVGVGESRLRAARVLLAEAADLARHRHPDIAVLTSAVAGPAAAALARASRGAVLLVMGRRRLDRLEAMFSASASARTLAEADCPVLVVHEADPVPQAQVVAAVDVDGYAQEVLAYAFAEAARRGVPLRAVHVFNKPWVFETEGDVVDTDAVLAADQADLETRLQVLIRLGEADHPDVGVYPDVLKGGSPETVLIEASQTADLLVLGARRAADMRGGLEVGPVVRALLQDAACPVEVVPVA